MGIINIEMSHVNVGTEKGAFLKMIVHEGTPGYFIPFAANGAVAPQPQKPSVTAPVGLIQHIRNDATHSLIDKGDGTGVRCAVEGCEYNRNR